MADTFDQWCVVELFGHTRLAGRVMEQAIGGATFVRIDVPDGGGFYTKLIGPSAIYSLTPCTEEVARQAAAAIGARPVRAIPLPDLTAHHQADDYDPDDDAEADDGDLPY